MKWLKSLFGVKTGPKYPPVMVVASPNFTAGVDREIDHIVLHNTVSPASPAISWLQNPAANASAHYLVDRDGKAFQLVEEKNVAWHAGNRLMNGRSIGIEIVAYGAAKDRSAAIGMTLAQEAVVIQLVKAVMAKYSIPLVNVIPHRKVRATECPSLVWKTDADFEKWKVENLK